MHEQQKILSLSASRGIRFRHSLNEVGEWVGARWTSLQLWAGRHALELALFGLLSNVATGYWFYWLGVKQAAAANAKAEQISSAFGSVQLQGVADDPSSAIITAFVNSQTNFDGVHLRFNGPRIEGLPGNDLTFEGQGSPQAFKVHFLDLRPNSVIVTCLIVPDTYASEKGKLAWVRQQFDARVSESGNIMFMPERLPALAKDEPSCESLGSNKR